MNAPEELSPELAIELAAERLNGELLSAGALVVVWAGAASAEHAEQQFLRAKGWERLADRRRRLSPEDERRREVVASFAEEAHKFYVRAKNERWQPVFRDVLVRYCSAYEHFIKRVAEVFELCPRDVRVPAKMLVPPGRVDQVRKIVANDWKKRFKATDPLTYLREAISERNPDPGRYRLQELLEDQGTWLTLSSAFELRNCIVHHGGRMTHQVLIDDQQLFVGDEADVTLGMLSAVRGAVQNVAHPFSRYWLM